MKHAKTFTEKVYDALKKVPRGKITTYKRLAALAGNPGAVRAVGRAMATNEHFHAIPCYKVVHEDGRVGHYSRVGVSKAALLKKDGAVIRNGRVVNFKDIVYPQ